jgi:hypothetical protein
LHAGELVGYETKQQRAACPFWDSAEQALPAEPQVAEPQVAEPQVEPQVYQNRTTSDTFITGPYN